MEIKLAPPLGAVAVATGAEDPAAIAFFRVWLGVEHARAHQVRRIELRVFGVNMEDGAPEHAHRRDGIDAAARKDGWDRKLQPTFCPAIERSRSIVSGLYDDEAGMHLDRDLHAVVGGELRMSIQ